MQRGFTKAMCLMSGKACERPGFALRSLGLGRLVHGGTGAASGVIDGCGVCRGTPCGVTRACALRARRPSWLFCLRALASSHLSVVAAGVRGDCSTVHCGRAWNGSCHVSSVSP